MFEFYKKEVASDKVLGPNSGFAPAVLRNILLQEYLRRLLNCSRELDRKSKMTHLTHFNLMMMKAGHTEKFRFNLTNTAIEIYDRKLKDPELFRTKEEVLEARKNKSNSRNWFNKSGEHDVVVNVPSTVNQQLLNSIRKTLGTVNQVKGTRVKLQQSYGRTIIDQLMTRNIGCQNLCDREDCLICLHPNSKGNCKKESVTYQISCSRPPCRDNFNSAKPFQFLDQPDQPPGLYRGETSRTGYMRGLGHLRDYRSKKDSSPLWRHTQTVHSSTLGEERGKLDYQMVQIEQWPRPMDRLSAEGVLIQELESMHRQGRADCLNSKLDYQQTHTVTLNFNQGSNL